MIADSVFETKVLNFEDNPDPTLLVYDQATREAVVKESILISEYSGPNLKLIPLEACHPEMGVRKR